MPVKTATVPFTANPVAKVPVKSVIAPKNMMKRGFIPN